MIEVPPKSFRIKRLRRLPPIVTSTAPAPDVNQIDTRRLPDTNHINTTKNIPYPKGTMSITLVAIVSEAAGITAREVNEQLKKINKRNKYYSPPDLSLESTVNSMLRKLTLDKRILTRIKINDVYHYYLRIN